MSFLDTCAVERACRIAGITRSLLSAGMTAVRLAHMDGAGRRDSEAVVRVILTEQLEAGASDARARPGFTVNEEFYVRLSEGRVALEHAMRILFPPAEEE